MIMLRGDKTYSRQQALQIAEAADQQVIQALGRYASQARKPQYNDRGAVGRAAAPLALPSEVNQVQHLRRDPERDRVLGSELSPSIRPLATPPGTRRAGIRRSQQHTPCKIPSRPGSAPRCQGAPARQTCPRGIATWHIRKMCQVAKQKCAAWRMCSPSPSSILGVSAKAPSTLRCQEADHEGQPASLPVCAADHMARRGVTTWPRSYNWTASKVRCGSSRLGDWRAIRSGPTDTSGGRCG